jgi:hypothetical protein
MLSFFRSSRETLRRQTDSAQLRHLRHLRHLKYYYAAHQSSERLLRITAASMYRDYMIAVG